jgi:hypothetical protein
MACSVSASIRSPRVVTGGSIVIGH